jgi:hypothetical protein
MPKFSLDFNALPPEITTLAESRDGFSDFMISSEIFLMVEEGLGDVVFFVFEEINGGLVFSHGGLGFGKFVFLIPKNIGSSRLMCL